jgi:hypothetical protein
MSHLLEAADEALEVVLLALQLLALQQLGLL